MDGHNFDANVISTADRGILLRCDNWSSEAKHEDSIHMRLSLKVLSELLRKKNISSVIQHDIHSFSTGDTH
jgi:hypothetical protein